MVSKWSKRENFLNLWKLLQFLPHPILVRVADAFCPDDLRRPKRHRE